jgi:hypothetical protein
MTPSLAPPSVDFVRSAPQRSAFSVLLVGSSPAFADRCQDAVAPTGADVLACGVESFMTVATRWRPSVIVLTEAEFAQDPEGFSEIASALGSTIVRLRRETKSREVLDASLVPRVFDALRRWERRFMN